MDASRRAFRTLQPFECHQIKSIEYSITGDVVLIAAGNAQVYAVLFMLDSLQGSLCTSFPLNPVSSTE